MFQSWKFANQIIIYASYSPLANELLLLRQNLHQSMPTTKIRIIDVANIMRTTTRLCLGGDGGL